MGPWDPSYSIPGEKPTHLHVKTTILAQKLWILVGPLEPSGGSDSKKHLEIIFHAFLGKVNEYGGSRNPINLF